MKKLIENQQLVSEWDWEKNIELDINSISGGSEIKVWWKCKNGHSWNAMVRNRFRLHSGCPYCAGLLPVKGENDLETLYPDLVKEWHPVKNGILMPSDCMAKSGKKVWWKCKNGHEWQATVYSRTAGCGCPICKKALKTSEPELIVYYYISNYFPDALNSYRAASLEDKELDVFIPSINVGIEYDGTRYHKNIDRDYHKDKLCLDQGITLYRLRESKCPVLTETTSIIFTLKDRSKDEFLRAILWLLSSLGIDSPDIHIERDLAAIRARQYHLEQKNSLAEKHPELIDEWDTYKNGEFTPSNVSYKSHKRVWWKCSVCGNEWSAPVSSRSNGFGCPRCGIERMVDVRNQRYLDTHGSLLDANPAFLLDWNYEKNTTISPDKVSIASNKKVWWKCRTCGYEWQATICGRKSGHGCNKCARIRRSTIQSRQAAKKSGSLLKMNPALATEWHPTKNGDLTPDMFSDGSNRKVWWSCSNGHEWQASISNRSRGRGCPYCSNRKVCSGFNDLQTRFPNVAQEWAYDKNGGITPADILPHTNKRYWWCCKQCGYEWQTSPNHRCSGQGCPQCAYRSLRTVLSNKC